ncbi:MULTISPECIES: hypothetical protein [unclassified Arthrobacter]|uniref:hypothetical protein n=1 Tax=unclassified Arthrobacter TaxID=235627 RepID=UPI0028832622|nr:MULTISPECIES: hypothetical protein [unclassified Arthrobacter]
MTENRVIANSPAQAVVFLETLAAIVESPRSPTAPTEPKTSPPTYAAWLQPSPPRPI